MIDQNSGESLFDKNSRAVVPIASITKLMTAMVVLDSKEPMTDQIEVTDEDRDYEKNTRFASVGWAWCCRVTTCCTSR